MPTDYAPCFRENHILGHIPFYAAISTLTLLLKQHLLMGVSVMCKRLLKEKLSIQVNGRLTGILSAMIMMMRVYAKRVLEYMWLEIVITITKFLSKAFQPLALLQEVSLKVKGPTVNQRLLKPIILAVIIWGGILPFKANAQSQKTDIRPNASQVIGEDIWAIFSGKTHDGSYNFNSAGIARSGYTEFHTADGRVYYEEEDIKSEGVWYVSGQNLCFVYKDEDMNGGCFRVYQVKNCYYYYSSELPQREDELDRDYWVARSTIAGDVPNCTAPNS